MSDNAHRVTPFGADGSAVKVNIWRAAYDKLMRGECCEVGKVECEDPTCPASPIRRHSPPPTAEG